VTSGVGEVGSTRRAREESKGRQCRLATFCYTTDMWWLIRCVVVLCFCFPLSIWASNYSFEEPTSPYAVVGLGSDVATTRELYGRLQGAPVMYELVATEPFTLRAVLSQYHASIPTAWVKLLVVRELSPGRVESVARLAVGPREGLPIADRVLGVSWYSTDPLSMELPPGVYRLEVSAPENEVVPTGAFRLTIGSQNSTSGYLATWARIISVQQFLERSFWTLLQSYFVLAHILIIVAAILFVTVRRYAGRLFNGHDRV
jgi:hypothetical protein